MSGDAECYTANDLTIFAAALFENAGLAGEKAEAMADILVEGDLMGHCS